MPVSISDTAARIWKRLLNTCSDVAKLVSDTQNWLVGSDQRLDVDTLNGVVQGLAAMFMKERAEARSVAGCEVCEPGYGTFNDQSRVSSRVQVLSRMLFYGRKLCHTYGGVYQEWCQGLLGGLLNELEQQVQQSSIGPLEPLYLYVCQLRSKRGKTAHSLSELVCSDDAHPSVLQILPVIVEEVLVVYNEASPPYREELSHRIKHVLAFDEYRYLTDFAEALGGLFGTYRDESSIIATLEVISNSEGSILSIVGDTLPSKCGFRPVKMLGKMCAIATEHMMRTDPEWYWSDVTHLIEGLTRNGDSTMEQAMLRLRPVLDYSVVALVLKKHHDQIATNLSQAFIRGLISKCIGISQLFDALSLVNGLIGHLGAYHSRILDNLYAYIRNHIQCAGDEGTDTLQTRLAQFAAVYMCHHQLLGNTAAIGRLLAHHTLFWSSTFEECMLVDLFSRMTTLRLTLESAIVEDTYTQLIGELQLLASLSSICKSPDYIKLHSYLLVAATGCDAPERIEELYRKVLHASLTLVDTHTVTHVTRLVLAALCPVDRDKVVYRVSGERLTESIIERLSRIRFAVIHLDGVTATKVLREDQCGAIQTILCSTTAHAASTSASAGYITIPPECADCQLIHVCDSDEHQAADTAKEQQENTAPGLLKLRVRARISWMVKTMGQIRLEELLASCGDQCADTETNCDGQMSSSLILDCVRDLIESEAIEWSGDNELTWCI